MGDGPRAAGPLPDDVEDAVLAVLEGDEGHRDTALSALLGEHPEHATAIRRWLAAAGVPLPDDPARGDARSDDALPQRLGAYLLQAVVGRGGFGTVYRAEQQEPIRRPVAVKVLNPGMDSREVLSRFAAEREALNRMDHPGIARLLDAGTTPKGRPFFVMELVDGPPLAKYCRQRDLPLRARLDLFLLVLDAMQHAHQKAVLHRDLSSNNVLVADPDGRAQPKIIDFGIAKSLADPLLEGGAMTFQGTLMGTPEFMSPEQASGRIGDVDTRADVYALGVQLYELLTDTLPIPGVVLRAQGVAGMADAIRRHEPVKPSDAAPKARRPDLLGDLDHIAMKAIAKARDERYPSVAEFAADLRRHLADQPLTITAPTTFYRLRKFVRRHRAQTIAAAIVAGGLIAAFVVMWISLRVARGALAELAQQKTVLDAKADAGFRLLANEERLRDATAAAAALPPPWPENEAALAGWCTRFAEPLATERTKLIARLAELAADKARLPGGQFADPVDRHLELALLRLREALDAFFGPDGANREVLQKLAFLRDVCRPSATEHRADWTAAIEAIQTSDGQVASKAYSGARIPVLSGLVPLGCNPRTKLFEFLDLASHAPGTALPGRDAAGDLDIPTGCGIVFTLVPAGTVRLGATRDAPGMPQYDPDADDGELHGELVHLDEFLLAETELTAGQWARLRGLQPEDGEDRMPAAGIDWPEAVRELLRFDMLLPSEAQWEYACRAGTTTPWWPGSDPTSLTDVARFGPQPQEAGRLRPNAFGLHDTHGNVAEWCRDEKLPYRDAKVRAGDGLRARDGDGDGRGDAANPRVVRGGAAPEGPLAARSAARSARAPTFRDSALGVRPVRRLRAGR